MIISQQKPLEQLLEQIKDYRKIFLVGCNECSAACKSGGEPELIKMREDLEKHGKTITGIALPAAPCIASKIKTELAKNSKALRESEAILVLACGLGVQSVKANDRMGLVVTPACDTLCGAVMDAQGNFYEKCSMCGDCILGITAAICPVTLCAKGILNGPCGGMNKGKCEVDTEKDCAWVLIYKELAAAKRLDTLRALQPPKDFKKMTKPHKIMAGK